MKGSLTEHVPTCIKLWAVSHSGLMVSKHPLYVGSLGLISTTATTSRTAVGGDAENVS